MPTLILAIARPVGAGQRAGGRLHREGCRRLLDRAAVDARHGTVTALTAAPLATCCKPTERHRAELLAQVTAPEPERTAADPCMAGD